MWVVIALLFLVLLVVLVFLIWNSSRVTPVVPTSASKRVSVPVTSVVQVGSSTCLYHLDNSGELNVPHARTNLKLKSSGQVLASGVATAKSLIVPLSVFGSSCVSVDDVSASVYMPAYLS